MDISFQEDVLRSYLGKYQERFKPIRPYDAYLNSKRKDIITLCTDPDPMIVAQMWVDPEARICLCEYVQVEQDDPYYGTFTFYQIDILTVSLADPDGPIKIESAIAKTFLTGTQSIRWNL